MLWEYHNMKKIVGVNEINNLICRETVLWYRLFVGTKLQTTGKLALGFPVHQNAPFICIPRHMNPTHTFASCFFKIHFIIICHIRVDLWSSLFSSGFPTKLNDFHFSSACHMPRPSHLPWSYHPNKIRSGVTILNANIQGLFWSLFLRRAEFTGPTSKHRMTEVLKDCVSFKIPLAWPECQGPWRQLRNAHAQYS